MMRNRCYQGIYNANTNAFSPLKFISYTSLFIHTQFVLLRSYIENFVEYAGGIFPLKQLPCCTNIRFTFICHERIKERKKNRKIYIKTVKINTKS